MILIAGRVVVFGLWHVRVVNSNVRYGMLTLICVK